MKNKDFLEIVGKIRIEVKDSNGNLLQDSGWHSNIITSVGKAAIAGLAGNVGSIPAFTYLALGSSATAVAIGDTALNSELTTNGLGRLSATVSRTTTTVTNDTLQLVGNWTASGSSTINEAGIFNNTLGSGTSILLSHVLTGTLSAVNTNVITVTYTVKFA